MLARLGCGDGDVAVDRVGAGDAHKVDVVTPDQVAPVRQHVFEAVRRRYPLGAVAGCGVGHRRQAGQVRRVRVVVQHPAQGTCVYLPHPAQADDADPELGSAGGRAHASSAFIPRVTSESDPRDCSSSWVSDSSSLPPAIIDVSSSKVISDLGKSPIEVPRRSSMKRSPTG